MTNPPLVQTSTVVKSMAAKTSQWDLMKVCPRRLSFPVRGWFDSVLLEYVADSRIRNVVADVGQGTLDPIVAP